MSAVVQVACSLVNGQLELFDINVIAHYEVIRLYASDQRSEFLIADPTRWSSTIPFLTSFSFQYFTHTLVPLSDVETLGVLETTIGL